jgi:beta-lactamase class C
MKYAILVSLILLAAVTILAVNYPKNNTEQIIPEKKETINPFLKEFIHDYATELEHQFWQSRTPGAAIVIIKDSTVLLQRGFGYKNVEERDGVDDNTVFRLASLSKGFAGILSGIMVEKGFIEWEDKVMTHVPGFQLKSKDQTFQTELGHVLSHTTGLPYHTYTNLVEAGETMEQIIPQFAEVRLIGQPGEIYAYQNAAYSLMDPVLEGATGKPYAKLLEEYLFDPLRMKSASTSYKAITSQENVALPHKRSSRGYAPDVITKKYYNAIPAGGVNASIDDMANYLQLLLGNRPDVISSQILDEVFKPRVKTKNKRRYFHDWPLVKEAFYGYGWRILDRAGETIVYHGGYVNRYRTEIAINRDRKIGICLLTNAPTDFSNDAIPTFFQKYDEYQDSIHVWEHEQMAELY